MKSIFLLFISLCITLMLQAQVSKNLEVTAGGLKTALTAEELTTVTNLTLTGIIDARDFKTLRDTLPHLNTLDLTDVNIVAYNGNEGPSSYYNYYQAKTIPAYAFYNPNTDKGKNSLTSILLPSSITTIDYSAFQKCNGLTSITIPSLVFSIGSSAFLSCNSLISVNIPASVTSIQSNAFGCSGLIVVDAGNPNYSSLDGVLFDKNRTTLLQCPTSKTGNYGIPSSVSFIGYEAFSNCNALTSITIPSSVTSIGSTAFNNCSAMLSVDDENQYYSSVDGVLFDKGMSRLIKCPASKTGSYVIPEKVTAIGEQAFYNCNLLSSITIPVSLTSFGYDAFALCTGLTTINANSSYPVILEPYTYIFVSVNKTTCTLNVPYGAKKYYAVADQWKDFTNMVEQPNGFILSSNILKILEEEGSSASVNLTANVAWTANSDQTWLTLNPTSGTGNNTLAFTATANTSVATRTAKVTVSASGFTSQTISVNQSGVLKSIDIEAGTLLSGLNTDELSQITRLTITGTMDARDFKIMRDRMPSLAELDLTGVAISAYTGSEGTSYNWDYFANSIPENAFYNWNSYPPKSNLTSVILPAGITAIGNSAFYYCKGLSSIILPPSVTSIGYSAFYYCTGLTLIVAESSFPVDLSSSWSVFAGVDNYKCILKVPYGSKDLYKAAYPWNNFTNIVENSQGFILSPTLIKFAAEGGSGLTANVKANISWTVRSDQPWLTVNPSSGTGDKTLTFTAEANPTVVTRTAKVSVSAPDVTSQSITISQQGIPKTVAVTAGSLLTVLTTAELNGITNLIITGTIDARDFKILRDNMPLLAALDLSGTTIAKYSGTEGTSYQSDYPANTVPENAFYNQNTGKAKIGLTSVGLPSSLTSVGSMSFYGCSALTSITVPSSLTSIGNMSFSGCSVLTSINIPTSVSFIGANAFNGCSKLTSFELPSSLTTIESGILTGCAGLTDISIPSTITSIGSFAFSGCTGLTSINIPSSVKTIGENAFSGCGKLTSVDIPSSVSRIENSTFSGCYGMTEVTIPSSVTLIGNSAFISCTNLTSITIPAAVTFIGENAFSYCNGLTSVTIPESVTSIGRSAFYNCNGLKTISSNSSHPVNLTAYPEVFSGINKTTCILNVPYKSKQLYAAADQWKDFTNIVEKTEGFLFDSSVLSFSAEGGNILVNSIANVLWTASSDQAWLTVNPGSGIGIRTITFTAEANQSNATRKAKVTISAPGILSQSITITQEGLPKVIENTAGNLLAGLTAEELSGITNLTITGTIDARDFKTIRDYMPILASLDLSGASINAYSGIEGTAGYENNYPANEIPIYVFLNQNTYTGKTSLTSVVLPTSLISIGNSAFQGCTGITSIIIPSSVTSIGPNTFSNCSGLTSIYADSSIPVDLSNSWSVFYGIDKNICKLYVPYQSKVRYVAAWQWQDFTNIVEPSQGILLSTAKLNLAGSAGSNATATITSNVSWTASSDQTWLTINPNSGTGDQTLTFTAEANPFQVVRKAQVTFSSTGIPSQTITVTQEASTAPLNVTAGNLKTLFTAEQLGQIIKLKLTGTIDARDFKTMRDDMPLLAELDLSGVTIAEYIGTEGTYWELGAIITYPANEIPIFAFQNEKFINTTLASVILPVNATSIGWDAFYCVTKLTSIFIPPTITNIGVSAFAGCHFSTVTIPSSVTQIDVVAFSGSGYINVETDNPNYCSVDGVLFNKNKTTIMQVPYSKTGSFTIPPSVTRIDDHAFEYCRDLTSVDIPSSVTSISHFAFLACSSLTSITIPSQVTYLGDWVFSDCTGLTSIYSHTLVPVDLSKSKNVFLNINKTTCTLYVPIGTKKLYAAANLWKDFQNIVEASFIELSTTDLNIAASHGSKADVKIISDVIWTASSDQSWLTLNPTTGTDKQTLVVTADANPSHLDRKAEITVSATGLDSQTIFVTQAASPVEVTAGNLKTLFTAEELATITRLKLTGTIDARDFRTMRDDMPLLAEIDLSGATVAAYTGTEGTFENIWGAVGYPADEVPYHAFYSDWQGRDILTSIILPQNIISIGEAAFWHCTGLTSVIIPPNVSSIGDMVFDNCSRLSSITIPPSVTMIGSNAFCSCRALVSIEIPSSVTTLGDYAFQDCTALIQVNANNPNYSSIDGVLFNKGQTKLIYFPGSKSGDFTIPSSVISVEAVAFAYNQGLSTITIPSSVQTMGYGTFWGCNGLTSIHASRSKPIDFKSSTDVFNYVDKTTCILYVPYGSKTAYQAADQWKDFVNIVEATSGFNLSVNDVNIAAAAGSTATATVTSNVDWTAISDQAWLTVNPSSGADNQVLTFTADSNPSRAYRKAQVKISATGFDSQIIYITQEATTAPLIVTAGSLKTSLTADELATLTKLKLTGTIDARDFKTMRDDMPMLAEIDLSGATIVAYNGNEGTNTTITQYPANAIPASAFYIDETGKSKTSLNFFKFPSQIVSIDRWAFFGCTGLTSINLPTSVTSIGQGAFGECTGLTSLIIPSSVISIGLGAFEFCSNLTSVIIPSSVTSIGAGGFQDCNKLTTVTIPSSVISIGIFAFYNSVSEINVDKNNPKYSSIDGVLFNKSQTTLIEYPSLRTGNYIIPSSVTTIAEFAFANCSGLASCKIPSSVNSIERAAFNGSGLTTVAIPSSVAFIGELAFCGCTSLTSILAQSSYPIDLITSENVFLYVDKNTCTLNVPYGSKELYATSNQWKDFTNIVEVPFIELSATEINLAASQGSKADIRIVSDVTWTASSNQSWLTINPGSGTDEQMLVLTAEANPSHFERKAIVTVSATGIDSQTIDVTQAASPVEVTAGNLKTQLSAEELAAITKLKLTGTIDARDFKTMRDDMPLLAEIDLRGTTVAKYTGTEGTAGNNNITYPENAIPDFAFYNNTISSGKISLNSVILPSAITAIGGWAFSNCNGFTSIYIPTFVNSIGYCSFYFCRGLTSITIPASVSSIGNSAFQGSTGMILVDENNLNYSSVDGILFNKPKTTLIQCTTSKTGTYAIPSSVTSVGDDAFSFCYNLTSVNFPLAVTSIGNHAFANCNSLTSVNIPSSITYVANSAFWYCLNLDSLISERSLPLDLSLSSDVFTGVNKTTCTLYVPYGSKELYSDANQWKDFSNILEMPGFVLSADTDSIKSKQGSTIEINISSNTSWSVSSDQSWLMVNPSSGTGNQTLTFTAEGNPVNALRTATVTVSAPGVESKTITVIQKVWPTGLDDLAETFSQLKCYPNPFTDEIAIEIQNPKHTEISMDIYNLAGERIKNLATQKKDEKLDLKWNGTNDSGQKVVPGVYICKVNNRSKQLIYQGQKGKN